MKAILLSLFALTAGTIAEPFEVDVTITRQDSSMDWWYAVPSQFTPERSQIDTVAKGEYFRIIPFFQGYGVDTNDHAKITYDFEVLKPDGSVYKILTDCVGLDGKYLESAVAPSQAVLNFSFYEEDPFGDYSINLTGYDDISGTTNSQSILITLKKFSGEIFSDSEMEKIFTTYASKPNPTLAFSSFLQTKQSFFNADNEPIWSAIWFYKTIFDHNDYLIPPLIRRFYTARKKQQEDIILLMFLIDKLDQLPEISNDLKSYKILIESGRVPDPYGDVVSGKQLDMLWAEYFATGSIKPIRQLITALKLIKHRGTLDKIKAGELDSNNSEVYRAGLLEATFQSALWSLRTNCKKDQLLFHYYIGILNSEELEKTTQSCLGMLLQSVNSDNEL